MLYNENDACAMRNATYVIWCYDAYIRGERENGRYLWSFSYEYFRFFSWLERHGAYAFVKWRKRRETLRSSTKTVSVLSLQIILGCLVYKRDVRTYT